MEEKKIPDDEILRLLEIFAKDDEPNGVRLLAEGALDLIRRLQIENERLTEENECLDMVAKQALTDYQNTQVQVDELRDKLGKVLSGIKADEFLTARGVEQAVKDTAKEILQKIMNIIKKSNGFLAEEVVRIMAKQKGVEVE